MKKFLLSAHTAAITPNGTHDDVFWSNALAVYATVDIQPEPCLTIIPR